MHLISRRKNKSENYYVGGRFARFLLTVTYLASRDGGGFRLDKVLCQLRIAFHKKSIAEDPESDVDEALGEEEVLETDFEDFEEEN